MRCTKTARKYQTPTKHTQQIQCRTPQRPLKRHQKPPNEQLNRLPCNFCAGFMSANACGFSDHGFITKSSAFSKSVLHRRTAAWYANPTSFSDDCATL